MTTMSLSRGHVELLQFLRDRTALIFTFFFPALLLVLFNTIFGSEATDGGVAVSRIFTASMIAYGILNTAFVTMGSGLAMDRSDGTLKRLRGTPMPVSAYLIGKALLVLALSLAETAALIAVGVLLFDTPLPEAAHWLTFGWVFVLSVIACSLLGVAVSVLVTNARNAGAILNVPVVALQFVSGVFIHPMSQLPDWLEQAASIFPVRWMAQGFRYVFLPESAGAQEIGGGWALGTVAMVLGAWCVVGLVLCLMTFRWSGRDK